jgi:hypothetical protein
MNGKNKMIQTLRGSLIALFISWLACNLAWWLGSVPVLIGTEVWQAENFFALAFIVGFNTAVVIFGVWLLLALPLEWLLRMNWSRHGARGGFLAAVPFALLWVAGSVFLFTRESQVPGAGGSPVKGEVFFGTLPYVLATLAAGAAFGWARARILHWAV